MKRVLSSSLICLVLALYGSAANADDSASTSSSASTAGKHHHPPKPPKEAYTACANLVENDACTITTPRGDVIDGTCAPRPPWGLLPVVAQQPRALCWPAALPICHHHPKMVASREKGLRPMQVPRSKPGLCVPGV